MLLVDTGVLYALADRDDAWHRPSVDLLRVTRDSWLVPVTVLPEAAYLIHSRLGADAERRFVRSIVLQELAVESLAAADWTRGAELLDRYADIGMVDATVVAIAERLPPVNDCDDRQAPLQHGPSASSTGLRAGAVIARSAIRATARRVQLLLALIVAASAPAW